MLLCLGGYMARKTNTNINGNEYYRITKTIGHKADGTPIKKQFYGTGINEANEKANEYINNIRNGLVENYETYSINDLLHEWLFQIKINELKPSSFESYEGTYRNYIKNSEIAGEKISKINKISIQQYYNKLGKTKTYSQIKKLNKLLNQFFNYCIEEGYLLRNPCNKLTIPNKENVLKNKNKDFNYFTEEQIKQLKVAFKGNKFENLILLALGTGMRQGELLGLKWENVHLDKGYIEVKNSLKTVYIFDSDGKKERKQIINTPKNHKSRIIDLPTKIIDMLSAMDNKTTFVFEDINGQPYSAKTLFGNWKKVLNDNNIEYKKFHALRHTYGTMLIANGVDLKTVQELMGHYDISVTQIYLHALPKTKKESVNKLNNIL